MWLTMTCDVASYMPMLEPTVCPTLVLFFCVVFLKHQRRCSRNPFPGRTLSRATCGPTKSDTQPNGTCGGQEGAQNETNIPFFVRRIAADLDLVGYGCKFFVEPWAWLSGSENRRRRQKA